MRSIPDTAVAAIARCGSLIALALTLWHACAALQIPFIVYLPVLVAAVALAMRSTSAKEENRATSLPAAPLCAVAAILLSPFVGLLHAASGRWPHWFASADDAYTLLIARGMRYGFPPPDLSWSGGTIHYHLGGARLTDLLSRLTFLPPHAVYYGLMPVVMKLVLIAAILECARLAAPNLDPRLRVTVPLAVGGLITIDWYNILWHLHDAAVRGIGPTLHAGVPVLLLHPGLFSRHAVDAAWLAVTFMIVLAATWERTGIVEKAALLFAVFLSKQQVFLAAGIAFGIVAVIELMRRNWRPAAAGALALGGAIVALPAGSTYGPLAHLTLGCGRFCRELLTHHGLASRLPHSLLLVAEILLFAAGLHLFALTIILRSRPYSIARVMLLSFALAGPVIALGLRLVASPLLHARFLAVHTPVASRLFMPLTGYLDGILDVAIMAAFTTLPLVLPVLAIPLAAWWMQSTPRPVTRRALATWLLITVLASAWNSSFITLLHSDRAKEIQPDAMAALRAIPADARSILTNDLAYDDRVEGHLPLLNIWAPAASGRQFYASAFMFNFQYPDSAERLNKVRWFFSEATDDERTREARRLGIDVVLMRTDLGPVRRWNGWNLLGRFGPYELYQKRSK